MTLNPANDQLNLRRYFPAFWSLLLVVGTTHAVVMLFREGLQYSWMGALFGCLAVPLALSPFVLGKRARSDENLSTLHMLTAIAPMLILYDLLQGNRAGLWPLVYAVVFAYGGSLLYLFWYSKPQRLVNPALAPGQMLPSPLMALKPKDSKWVVLLGQGSWSGLCRAQANELNALATDLSKHNAVFSSLIPSTENTKALEVAQQLNLLRANGTLFPFEVFGMSKHCPWPTLLVANEQGRILFSDQPANTRLRVEPELILNVLGIVHTKYGD